METIIWAGAAWLDSSSDPLPDHAVLVKDNQITEIGTRQDLGQHYPHAKQVGGSRFVLMPGLVNSHDHGRGLGTASLGVSDDLLEIWLLGLYQLPSIDPYLATAFDGIRLLKSGVCSTTHSHNAGNFENLFTEIQESLKGYQNAGIRVAFHPTFSDQNHLVYHGEAEFIAQLPDHLRPLAHSMLADPNRKSEDYFRLCESLLEEVNSNPNSIAQIQAGPVGGQWCSDALIMSAVEFARNNQTRVQMHMLETRYQMHYAYKKWGVSFVQHLEEIGALGPWLTLAHMIWVDENDIEMIAERGVSIAHNPSSNLRLRSGIAPLAEFIAASVKVGIGLDGHGLDDDQDFLRELRLAWTLSKRPTDTLTQVSAPDIWQAATSGGAQASFGEDAKIGKLRPGYLADLVLLDMQKAWGQWSPLDFPDLNRLPEYLLHIASAEHVENVMVNGKWVIWEQKATQVDEEALTAEIREALATSKLKNHTDTQAYLQLGQHIRKLYVSWEPEIQKYCQGSYNPLP